MSNLKFDNDMNYFVMSDLHGQGKLYDLVVNHFDEKAKETNEKITLIIDGDVIDRGPDSIRILLDIMDRVKNKKGNFNMVLLAGNHECMMYHAIDYCLKNQQWNDKEIWFHSANGGFETAKEFCKLPDNKKIELCKFLCDLPLFCKIEGRKDETSYVIVHALPPKEALTMEHVPTISEIHKSKENYKKFINCLWYRKSSDEERVSIPNQNVITIIGHTPVYTEDGYIREEDGRLLMIDGGCASMAEFSDSVEIPFALSLVHLNPNRRKIEIATLGDCEQRNLRMAATNQNSMSRNIDLYEKDKFVEEMLKNILIKFGGNKLQKGKDNIQVKEQLESYLEEGDPLYITSFDGLRSEVVMCNFREKLSEYLMRNSKSLDEAILDAKESILKDALWELYEKNGDSYDITFAVKRLVNSDTYDGFTRTNNSRKNVMSALSSHDIERLFTRKYGYDYMNIQNHDMTKLRKFRDECIDVYVDKLFKEKCASIILKNNPKKFEQKKGANSGSLLKKLFRKNR